ncbi:MAG TPA: MOSC domain-containing protein, partial [Polyangiales bacterium]|nr:MOSC domain-containing protein [Polyangiales bacterium]
IADLSARTNMTLVPERFRPTILISGSEAYAEDTWRKLRIGEVRFDVLKPCSRCVVTTIDPQTAERGTEPLATLAKYRKQGSNVNFGQNCVHRELGNIRVGDTVEVLAE